MKKRSSKKKISMAVRKAYKEARQWCKLRCGYCYQIMIDTDDAKIWCDVFVNENSWNEYHSDTIHFLFPRPDGYTVSEKENGYTTEAVRMLKEAGWEIMEEA